jgi:hypothetical protein
MTLIGFNKPVLGCPPLLNNSPSLTYSALKPAIFSRAVTDLTLFYDKKIKIKQAKLFKISMLYFWKDFGRRRGNALYLS